MMLHRLLLLRATSSTAATPSAAFTYWVGQVMAMDSELHVTSQSAEHSIRQLRHAQVVAPVTVLAMIVAVTVARQKTIAIIVAMPVRMPLQ